MRVFAAQAVLVGHSISYLDIAHFLQPPRAPYIQNIGVVVFFMLSGFSIAYSVRTKTASPSYTFRAYFVDRFSRVFSAYLPCLLLVAAIDFAHALFFPGHYSFAGAFDLKTFVGNLFMLQDYPVFPFLSRLGLVLGGLNITSFGSARPLWTMTVFWWLYMFYGWLHFATDLLSRIRMYLYLLVLALLAVVPIYNLEGRGGGLTVVWFFGAGMEFLWSRGRLQCIGPRTLGIASVMVLSLASAYAYLVSRNAYDLTFSGLLSVALLLALGWLAGSTEPRGGERWISRVHSFVTPFAKYSFTLFLLHYSLIEFLLPLTSSWNPWTSLFLFVGVSNATAALVSLGTGTIQRWGRGRLRSIYCR
jgi:peptidoglycan/LPS O-acetylase OafA/YrhL